MKTRTYGLVEATRYDHNRREWAVLELDGRRYLVDAELRSAVPAHDRQPGEYVWLPARKRRQRPTGNARSKTLAKLLRARLRELAKAA